MANPELIASIWGQPNRKNKLNLREGNRTEVTVEKKRGPTDWFEKITGRSAI